MEISQLYAIYERHPMITTDSRDCKKDSIFLALKGASFDGNKFASVALDKGCAYAIVDEKEFFDEDDGRMILVDDVLTTFKELAREHRRHFRIPVIGVTGTNGKTTTKELIAAVLREKYNVMFTQGNFNNDVGVPKTLFTLTPEHEIAVVEMGASHPGDIRKLVEYVEPTCGLITNVGRAHLQGFGSFEGVKTTKGELYDFLVTHKAQVFLNADSEDLRQMTIQRGISHPVTYGQSPSAEIRGVVVDSDPFLRFLWAGHEIKTHLIGSYNIDNMLAAIAVGMRFEVDDKQIIHALENYIPHNNRSVLENTSRNRLIIDAYNANPSSMTVAIDNFTRMKSKRKMAILGDMRELGTVSTEEHQKIVDMLETAGLKEVWLVGGEFAKTRCDFRKFQDIEEVKTFVATHQPTGYDILIKGSNGIHLFDLSALL